MRAIYFALPVAAIGIISIPLSSMALRASDKSLAESEIAAAFACGTVHGKDAIMNAMPDLFPPSTISLPDGCERFSTLAARHGFNE